MDRYYFVVNPAVPQIARQRNNGPFFRIINFINVSGSSESSGSENSTLNLTSNGSTSLVDLWLQENRVPESTC